MPGTDASGTTEAPATTQAPDATEAPAGLTDVSLRVDWFISGQQAPFFVAEELGFYEAAGLNVDIIEGSGSSDGAKLAGTNEVQHAIATAVIATIAYAVAFITPNVLLPPFWVRAALLVITPPALIAGAYVRAQARAVREERT